MHSGEGRQFAAPSDLAALAEICRGLDSEGADIEQAVRQVMRILGAERGLLTLHPDYPGVGSEQPAGGLLVTRGKVETKGREVVILPDGGEIKEAGLRSGLYAPISYSGQSLAALTLAHSQPQYFGENDRLVVMIVSQQMGAAIQQHLSSVKVATQQQQLETLQDLNRFKDEMLKLASHDLRSPLAMIAGYASLIALDVPDGAPSHQYLAAIERSTDRMNGLLDALLRVEQVRTSPLELHEQIEPYLLFRTVMDEMRAVADQKRQQIEETSTLEGLEDGLLADPTLLREAMVNLISNAIKYTPEGGTIRVRMFTADGRFHFEVEDSGIGIPAELLPRLFQSFYRAKQPGTEHIDGHGLGLSLVKTVIERHQGEVWVESEPNAGSTFGFWLPL